MPLIISVASDDDAIAEPQPNVLNLASAIMPSLTRISSRITSPHAGAPTRPVPTSLASTSDCDLNVPTFRGFS
jgi:hypothetical protein